MRVRAPELPLNQAWLNIDRPLSLQQLRGQVVKTIAGTGKQSQNLRPHGGTGLATELNSPWDVQQIGKSLFIAMAGAHQIWELQLETLDFCFP